MTRSALLALVLLSVACSGRSNSTNVIVVDGSSGEGGDGPVGVGKGGSGGTAGTAGTGASSEGGTGGAETSGGAGLSGEASAGEAGAPAAGAGGSAGSGGADSGSAGTGGTHVPALSSCDNTLTVYLRDFQPETHPDFEPQNENLPGHVPGKEAEADLGIVAPTIDANWKPVYAGHATNGTRTTTGKGNFDVWFRDTPGLNMGVDYTLEFADLEGDGTFTFDRTGASSNQFFPLDDGDACPATPTTPCLLGNWPEYPTHNFHMTMELHATFVYRAGQVFTFYGDDDAWVFVNGQLVADLGGIHEPQEKVVSITGFASQLGLVAGDGYRLDFFWAERKVVNSNFRIETNIEFADCGLPPVIR